MTDDPSLWLHKAITYAHRAEQGSFEFAALSTAFSNLILAQEVIDRLEAAAEAKKDWEAFLDIGRTRIIAREEGWT